MNEIELALKEAKAIVDFFGGDEEGTVTVIRGDENYHSGPGLYALCTDYPEEGCVLLSEKPVTADVEK